MHGQMADRLGAGDSASWRHGVWLRDRALHTTASYAGGKFTFVWPQPRGQNAKSKKNELKLRDTGVGHEEQQIQKQAFCKKGYYQGFAFSECSH